MQKDTSDKHFTNIRGCVKYILFITFILFSGIILSIPQVHSNSINPQVEVKHTIQVTKGGLVIITEQVTLFNNSTEPITNFSVGFHHNFTNYLENVMAVNAMGDPLTVKQGDDDNIINIDWMDVMFSVPIEANTPFNFSVIFIFSQLITYNESSLDYTMTIPQYPALSFPASSCLVELHLSNDLTFVESTWGNTTTHTKSPLQENVTQTGFVTFKGTLQSIECTSIDREITINSWGRIVFKDFYQIRNLGHATITELDFPIIQDAVNIIAYDKFGSLASPNIAEGGEELKAFITFRYPLRGVEDTVQYHDSYSFTIEYNLQNQDHLIQINPLSVYQFKVELSSSPDWIMKNVIITIILPEGAGNLEFSPTPVRHSQNLFTKIISYELLSLTPYEKYLIIINYDYNIFWSALRPTLWVGLMCAVIGGVVLLNRKKKPKAPPTQSKQFELIMQYTEILEERLSLWNDLDTLEKDFDNRSIRRKAFNRRRRILTQRVRTLRRRLRI